MVEGTCEETKGRVVCGPGISEEFRVDANPTVVLRSSGGDQQDSEYEGHSPQLIYADDLTVVVNCEAGNLWQT